MSGKIAICTPHPDLTAFAEQSILGAHPECQIIKAHSIQELPGYLKADPAIQGVLCDIFWDNQNLYEFLLQISIFHPRQAWCILSPYDLSQIVTVFDPFPVISAPQVPEDVTCHLPFLFQNIAGMQVGNYLVSGVAGQTFLGRTFTGKHDKIDRIVHLTVPPPSATEEDLRFFRIASTTLGKVVHPVIYAIYESGESNGVPFLAHEPPNAPTLMELRSLQQPLHPRTTARILAKAGVALNYFHSMGIHPHALNLSLITATPGADSVVKLKNFGTGSPTPLVDDATQLQILANSMLTFPMPMMGFPASLSTLLQRMQYRSIPLPEFIQEAERIDVELAPEKVVIQRQETIVAQTEVEKARKTFWIWAIVGAVAATIFLLLFSGIVVEKLVPFKGTDYYEQVKITEGTVKPAFDGAADITVNTFYMDQYEVTIGQYEKFLDAIKDKTITMILPDAALPANFPKREEALAEFRTYKLRKKRPDATEASTFEPDDWDRMVDAARFRKRYRGQKLNRNAPIFSVDFVDALAYAYWAGKRLPTEAEWQRAAAGDANTKFPWGNDDKTENANTGADSDLLQNGPPAGSIDGFSGPAPVARHETDKGAQFSVFNLAGNVAEWTVFVPGMDPASSRSGRDAEPKVQIVRGGSYDDPTLVPNQMRLPSEFSQRHYKLGIRLASDKKIEPPAKE